jgi:hypothetical protein
LTPGEEVHLAKAWLYLKDLQNPEQFALFQANYMVEMLGLQTQDIRWRIRRVLESARETESAQGLNGVRVFLDRQIEKLPTVGDQLASLAPTATDRLQRDSERWQELDQKTRQEISSFLPIEAQSAFNTIFPTVLNFDANLRCDPAQAQANAEFAGLTPDQIFAGWPKRPGSSYARLAPISMK